MGRGSAPLGVFLDGLDGLASSVTALGALGSFVVLAGWGATLAIALVGALAGFLVWNAPPAKVHLGDSGSYLIGTALALLFLAAAPGDAPEVSAAFLFVGVPVADTAVAIVRRLRAHRPLMQGDRGHVYDQLVDRGWSVNLAVLACAAAQAVLTAIGIGVSNLDGGAAIAVTLATIAVVAAGALLVFTSPRAWTS
jgi:UDP-GlcNAc:undecaprenyl-phosphate GlcNAc-1-phosphate transferase